MDQNAPETQPVRKSVTIVLLLVLAFTGALLVFLLKPTTTPSVDSTAPGTAHPPDSGNETRAGAKPPSNLGISTTQAPSSTVPTGSDAPSATSDARLPAASDAMRSVISSLSKLNLTNGPLTAEKLATWHQGLHELTQAGIEAVPAIRDFLQSKEDVNFESVGGSAKVGHASLRLALLETLVKIGGPESTIVLGESLRSTREPREIGFLVTNLDRLAPGEYIEPALDSARSALADAQSGKLGKTDVAALFDVLQRYGGSAAVPDLIEAKGRWTYYSAIALANLPDAAGVPGLIQLSQEASPATRSAALQMLGQLATDSPEAREALLAQARSGQIHPAVWMKMSALLAGERLQLGGVPDIGLPPPQDPKISSYHISGGNQNFYTTSVLDKLTPDQIKQRVQLIDQLLAVNPDPVAVESLQRARTTLSERASAGPR